MVANGLSAMVVQAGAVPRVLAAGDTARRRRGARVIEETGRDALAEMRRLLGVLRHDGRRAELAPAAGPRPARRAARAHARAGLEVSSRSTGTRASSRREST